MKREAQFVLAERALKRQRRKSDAPVSTKMTKRHLRKAILATQETKMFLDTAFTTGGDPCDNTGFNVISNDYTAVKVFPQSQGSNDSQYIGYQITPVYVKIKGVVHWNNPGSYNNVCLVLVQWKGIPPANPPSVNALLQTGSNSVSPLSGWDELNKTNIRILRVINISIDQYTNANHYFEMKVSKFPIEAIRYSDTSGTPSDGAVYLYAISDSATASTTKPFVEYYCQMFFKDA